MNAELTEPLSFPLLARHRLALALVRRITALALWLLACQGCLFDRQAPAVAADLGAAPDAQLSAPSVLARLAKDTGVAWRVRRRPGAGTAAVLEAQGPAAPLALTAGSGDPRDEAARRLLLRLLPAFGLARSADLRRVAARDDLLGQRHVRFIALRDGVPLHRGALLVHLDSRGAPLRVHAATASLPDDLHPAFPLAPAQAERAASAYLAPLSPWPGLLSAEDDPRRVLARRGDAVVGAYSVVIGGQGPLLPLRRRVLVDARDGAVLGDEDLLYTLDARPATIQAPGTGGPRTLSVSLLEDDKGPRYQLVDLLRGSAKTATWAVRTPYGDGGRPTGAAFGKPLETRDPARWDGDGPAAGAAVDVHAHLATLFDYFQREHGLLGPAGDGAGALGAVHYRAPGAPPQPAGVAFYDGRALAFGDGADGASPRTTLDIVAHEYAHAVLDQAAALPFDGEAGALCEGAADFFAALATRAAGGSGWQVAGADLGDPERAGRARRLGDLPSLPSFTVVAPGGTVDLARDAARATWRRAAAGVVAYAGYRSAARLGDRAAGALWYRALSVYLHEGADLADLGDALVAAGRDLMPEDTAALAALLAEVGLATVDSDGELVSAGPR